MPFLTGVDRWCVVSGVVPLALDVLGEASVDAIVTDPPYELGFMGKKWDRSGVAFDPATWATALRVLKPGGHMVAFGGTRGFHRIACAIEDAGFDIRDCLSWMYGSGFPKSLNVSKAIAESCERELCEVGADPSHAEPLVSQWDGWGTALKPAWEPIILARKPLVGTVAANVLEHGTGGINVDATRIGRPDGDRIEYGVDGDEGCGSTSVYGFRPADRGAYKPDALGRWPANVVLDEEAAALLDEQSGERKSGIAVQRNGGGCKIWDSPNRIGPRPDAGYTDAGGASRFFYCAKTSAKEREAGLEHLPKHGAGELTDREDGSDGLKSPRAGAGRTAKGRANVHPTVKPIALMRWLVRLVTPPGGLIVDPFCGSGTTGCAAVLEGFRFVGIDMTEEYARIAQARIAHWAKQANDEVQPSLFGGAA